MKIAAQAGNRSCGGDSRGNILNRLRTIKDRQAFMLELSSALKITALARPQRHVSKGIGHAPCVIQFPVPVQRLFPLREGTIQKSLSPIGDAEMRRDNCLERRNGWRSL